MGIAAFNRATLGRLALSGLVIGVIIGVVFGLIRNSLWAGVLQGVVYGIGLPIANHIFRRSTAMDGLSFRQRRTVTRKLRDGEGADDPELARALIEQGNDIERTPFTPKVAGIAAGVLFASGATVAVLGITSIGAQGLLVGVPLILMSLVIVYEIVNLSERRRELAAESVRATEELVHKG